MNLLGVNKVQFLHNFRRVSHMCWTEFKYQCIPNENGSIQNCDIICVKLNKLLFSLVKLIST